MAELATKFNIGCVIPYYSDQWFKWLSTKASNLDAIQILTKKVLICTSITK